MVQKRKSMNILVIPTDPLSVYKEQGNLEQFMDRPKYYAEKLGHVYVYNKDTKNVNRQV